MSLEGQAGQGPAHPDVVDGVPAHGRRLEAADVSGPFRAKALWETMRVQRALLRPFIECCQHQTVATRIPSQGTQVTWAPLSQLMDPLLGSRRKVSVSSA